MGGALQLREARPGDLGRLLELAARVLQFDTAAATQEASHLAERLEMPPGEDHFLLLVEACAEAPLAGYLSGGASRDEDRKGSAEIYELLVVRAEVAAEAEGQLLRAALEILGGAGYEAVLAWAGAGARVSAEGLVATGFSPDGARRPGACRHVLVL